MKWAIVVLAVLVLALAGSTAYLGYDRIASDEDGESEQQPASEVAGVTPTVGPSVDLDLSRRCFDAWLELSMQSEVMMRAPEGADLRQWLDTALGAGWQDRSGKALILWREACLSPSVVPVSHPVSDIDVLCAAARAEALRMSWTPHDEMSGTDAARLTVLETFVRSHCR